jgi:hypothetical protein
MDWLRSEDLKEVKVVTAPLKHYSRLDEGSLIQFDQSSCRTGEITSNNG